MLRHETTTKPKPARNTGPHSLWAEAIMALESERAIAAMVANTIIQNYTNRTDQRGKKTADFINEYVSYLEGQTINAIQAFHQELLNKSVPENIKKSLVAQYLRQLEKQKTDLLEYFEINIQEAAHQQQIAPEKFSEKELPAQPTTPPRKRKRTSLDPKKEFDRRDIEIVSKPEDFHTPWLTPDSRKIILTPPNKKFINDSITTLSHLIDSLPPQKLKARQKKALSELPITVLNNIKNLYTYLFRETSSSAIGLAHTALFELLNQQTIGEYTHHEKTAGLANAISNVIDGPITDLESLLGPENKPALEPIKRYLQVQFNNLLRILDLAKENKDNSIATTIATILNRKNCYEVSSEERSESINNAHARTFDGIKDSPPRNNAMFSQFVRAVNNISFNRGGARNPKIKMARARLPIPSDSSSDEEDIPQQPLAHSFHRLSIKEEDKRNFSTSSNSSSDEEDSELKKRKKHSNFFACLNNDSSAPSSPTNSSNDEDSALSSPANSSSNSESIILTSPTQ